MATHQQLLEQHVRNMQMAEYDKAKKDMQRRQIPNYINAASKGMNSGGQKLADWGTAMSGSQNPTVQSIGNKMQTFGGYMQDASGQPLYNGLKDKAGSFLADKLGLGGAQTASTGAVGQGITQAAPAATSVLPTAVGTTEGAGALGALGSTAGTAGTTAAGSGSALGSAIGSATTAGTAAGAGAGTSAIGSAIGAAAPAATSAGAAGAAGAGAAAGGAGAGAAALGALGPIGAGLAVAALIYNMFQSAQKKKQQAAMQKDMENVQRTQQEDAQKKSGVINDLDQNINGNIQNLSQATQPEPIGQFGLGNIDLYNRPQVKNDDGSISTVRSMSFNDGTNEVLIPTVSDDGTIMSDKDAINNYYNTGKYLGKFNSVEDANNYADRLHNEQSNYYQNNNKQGLINSLMSNFRGQPTGAAAPVNFQNATPEDTNIQFNPLTSNQAQQTTDPKQSLKDKLVGGFKDMYAGYKDNSTNGLMQGDLVNQLVAQPQQPTNEVLTNYQDQLLNAGYDQNVVDAVAEGKNSGYKEIDQWIKDNPEAFEQQGVLTGGASKAQPKSVWNRVGEAVGTGQRLLSNPIVQGLIAGTLYAKDKGDALYGLGKGVEWAQNKAKSNYYADQLGQPRNVFENYGDKDYNARTLSDYRNTMADNAQIRAQAQLDKTNPTMVDYANTMLASGEWDTDDYNKFINDPAYNASNRMSIDTIKAITDKNYKTNKAKVDTQNANTRAAQVADTRNYHQGKLKIDQQNADTRSKQVGYKMNKPNKADAPSQEQLNAMINNLKNSGKSPEKIKQFLKQEYGIEY